MSISEHQQEVADFHISAKDQTNPRSVKFNWIRLARPVWIIAAILAWGILIISIPAYILGVEQQLFLAGPVENPNLLIQTMNIAGATASFTSALLCLSLATVLFFRRNDDRMVMFVAFYLLGFGIFLPGPIEGLDILWPGFATAAYVLSAFLLTTPTIVLLCIFPNGQLFPGWTRWLILISIPLTPLLIFFSPNFKPSETSILLQFSAISWIIIISLAIYAAVTRYRKISTPGERKQTKWIIFGLVSTIIVMLILTIPWMWRISQPDGTEFPLWAHASATIWFLSMNILPISLVIAVTQYRLWDIDHILNRTMVYGGLTAASMGLYIFIVGYLGNMLQAQSRTMIAFLATGLVAVLFQPLRERLQLLVNRMMYGERDDPYAVLTKLGEQLEVTMEPQRVLPTIVESIAQTLKLPYVAIQLDGMQDGSTAASYGLPSPESQANFTRIPLVYQDDSIGMLILAPRASNEAFSISEERLLGDIARQVGVATHTVQLTEDLLRSRQRLVSAREEERRRLRRDLHDGLGPQLASFTLKLDTASNLLEHDPAGAIKLLSELKAQTRSAITDIRRIAYDLRPPALDEMGLVFALREQAEVFSQTEGCQVSINAPEKVPDLPAAVEVAVYRIAMEALTNCVRHAQADNCSLNLRINGSLKMEIKDDGQGLSKDAHVGIGLTSMKERAVELGGTCKIRNRPDGGTLVSVELPLIQKI